MDAIDRIDLYHVVIPLKKPFYPSWIPGHPQTENRFTLIKITTHDGIIGWSAGVAFENERQGLGSLLGPYLIGEDPTDLQTISQRLTEASFLGWRNWWIEPAFWDIIGKKERKPVYKLLNPSIGDVERLKVYCSTGSLMPARERCAYIDRIRTMGFEAVKLRVHSFDPEEDRAIVKAVREYVGEDFVIAVDANQGWRVTVIDDAPLWDLQRATEFAKYCEAYAVSWLEEPLEMHAYKELAELRRRTSTRIAGCELNAGWYECRECFEHGSYDIYQPDATFCGGLTTSNKVMERCAQEGLQFNPHTWTNGIGLLVNLHAYAAWPHRELLEYPYEPPGWVPEVRDGILAEPILPDKNGTIRVPNIPGLGIVIDEKKLKKYGTKFYSITKTRLALHTIRKKGLKVALELKRKRETRAHLHPELATRTAKVMHK